MLSITKEILLSYHIKIDVIDKTRIRYNNIIQKNKSLNCY